MNNKSLLIITMMILKVFTVSSVIATSNADNKYNEILNQYQNIIDEYKKYLSTVSDEVKKEIIDYRKEIIKINEQKQNLYKKLSQQAQGFLKVSNKFKKNLLNCSKNDKDTSIDKISKEKSEKK